MKPDLILKSDLLDILFENRNKEYGAYELRRQYERRLLTAVIGMLVLVLLVIASQSRLIKSAGLHERQPGKIEPPDTKIKTVEIIVQPKEPEKPVKPKAAIQNVPPTIVPDKLANDRMHTVDELDKPVQIGTQDTPGDSTENMGPPGEVTAAASTGNSNESEVEPAPEILEHSEFQPEFPGGEKAFMRFMQRNLRVPVDEMQPGQKVSVRARFIVDKDGHIRGMAIVGPGGEIFDKEVLRVLAKMPDWKPGRQAGKNVAVYFTLPVIFQSEVE